MTTPRAASSLLAALSEAADAPTLVARLHDRRSREQSELRSALARFGLDATEPWPASALFHRRSAIAHHDEPPLDPAEAAALTHDLDYKRYPGAPRLALPPAPAGGDLDRALRTRRSEHVFGTAPLPLAFVARCLGAGCGITAPGAAPPRRAAPSAGALYPIEVYAALLAVEGQEPALWHYHWLSGELERLRPLAGAADLWPLLCQGFWGVEPGLALLLSARLPRVQRKYADRGYRFALIECGHVAQNVLLLAAASGFAAVPVGGFVDDEVTRFLAIDGKEEVGLYAVLVGTRPERTPQPGKGGD